MKVLLESSVLVAAAVADHPDHERCLRWLERARAGEVELVVAAHSLVETYSVLTRLPIEPRIAPLDAERILARNVLPRARIVALTAAETTRLLARLAEHGIAGGAVYDALIARAAEKAEVDRIVTLNVAHFRRVAPGAAARVVAP